MDRSNFNVMSLFSGRPATPPQELPLQSSPPQPQLSPTHSYREPPPSSPPKTLDSLFRNISNNQSASSDTTPPATANMNNPFRNQAPTQPANHSGPGTPVSSVTAASGSSHGSANNQPPADRQSALLSLLGSTVGSNNGATVSATSGPSQPLIPHHPPSPPIDQRARLMHPGSEAQGKILLEQLMSG
ncbi:uncharacterized protein FOMMEDRAFT_153083 [Fomitiporia mediterranea MF3/22]|uniref:uncharacterized protein n=1 Tax=Fomitiporia mediterranea (strain MF3/22) TaxID=694068 RepID=UPI0004407A66|nr:uncharacterized protein FOMMEDRAFT_153083 [Fomitiporia mediterranea MF3/22]EJD05745.1 hypothetical protein FOMMEDRAFT_153083 [Fomitiporia mediterranea MF3/22]